MVTREGCSESVAREGLLDIVFRDQGGSLGDNCQGLGMVVREGLLGKGCLGGLLGTREGCQGWLLGRVVRDQGGLLGNREGFFMESCQGIIARDQGWLLGKSCQGRVSRKYYQVLGRVARDGCQGGLLDTREGCKRGCQGVLLVDIVREACKCRVVREGY